VQRHSLPVGHRKGCDKTDLKCNVTHCMLLVIGIDVMRLIFIECARSLTTLVGHRKRYGETALHNIFDVTHRLFVIGKDVI
jgi:hypothetical protein